MNDLLLGLDLGTSSVKALLTDAAGATVASASAGHPLSTPRPGWSEQDPSDWLRSAVHAVREALARAAAAGHPDAGARVAAIGFSGQMHGAVLVDGRDEPVRPCILWNDSRSAAECAELDARIGAPEILARTGNRMLPGFTAPKLRWVQRHEPDAWRRTDCVLLPKDWLRLKLGEVRATDAADASGTLYFDVANRRWSEAMLRDLGMRTAQVPACHESQEVVDRLSPAMAAAMGLAAGTPMVAGAGDQAAAAIGAGITAPGRLAATLGTSGVLFAASDRFRASPDGALHAFCHALPGRWHLMSVMLSAGGSLRWFIDTMARDLDARAAAEGRAIHEILDEEAARIARGSDGVTFVPTLAGERCPVPNPTACGSFHGLTLATTQAHLARAVLEGVAASMALCLGQVRAAGIQPSEAITAGGGFASKLWAQMHADAFGIPLRPASANEGSARGAALLAGLGVGVLGLETVENPVISGLPFNFNPDPDAHKPWESILEKQLFLQRNGISPNVKIQPADFLRGTDPEAP